MDPPLSDRWFVESMDGQRVEMGPGEISFGGDQNAKERRDEKAISLAWSVMCPLCSC
jgi:hypothetical protein